MFSHLAADDPAPRRSRVRNGLRTYWKCHIGNRVHLAREKVWGRDAGNRPAMTREALAHRMDMRAQQLWEIESGISPVDGAEIARIAEVLNIHPGGLFDDSPLEQWAKTSRGTPAWLLATTIGQMEQRDRDLLEAIVIRLDRRSAERPS